MTVVWRCGWPKHTEPRLKWQFVCILWTQLNKSLGANSILKICAASNCGRWCKPLNASPKTVHFQFTANAYAANRVFRWRQKPKLSHLFCQLVCVRHGWRDVPRNKLQFVIIIFSGFAENKNCRLKMTKIDEMVFQAKSQYFPFRWEECTTSAAAIIQYTCGRFVWRRLPFLLFSFKLVLIVGNVAPCSHAAKINK